MIFSSLDSNLLITICIYLFKHIFNLISNGEGKDAYSTLMGMSNIHLAYHFVEIH